jgi:hypothetical protein
MEIEMEMAGYWIGSCSGPLLAWIECPLNIMAAWASPLTKRQNLTGPDSTKLVSRAGHR